jgi:hypothetical protein
MVGFIVTWDADSNDPSLCGRLRRIIFGYSMDKPGRKYRYKGYVELPGVRYLGQSVLFLTQERVAELIGFLRSNGIPYAMMTASVGPIMPDWAEAIQ